MPPRADAALLNVQPRQRRVVYDALAMVPEGTSAKDLIEKLDIPERDIRDALRKLDAAGLAQRLKGVWLAIPLETADVEPPGGSAAATPGP
jgi:predicted ArsR family transcriptional regulator